LRGADQILSTRTDPRTFNALCYVSRHRNRARHLAVGIISDDRKAHLDVQFATAFVYRTRQSKAALKLRAAVCYGRIEAAPAAGPLVLWNNQIETLA
jgi:hypothetical protein